MLSWPKSAIKAAFRFCGYELHRHDWLVRSTQDPYEVMRHLVKNNSPIIYDVGANIGDTAKRFRALSPLPVSIALNPFPPLTRI